MTDQCAQDITLNCNNISIELNRLNIKLRPGVVVQLSRFDDTRWIVHYGWYTWGGNRAVCGWYLAQMRCPNKIKPLQMTDLKDIYLVEQ